MTQKWILVPVMSLAIAGCTGRAEERAAVRGALIGAAGGAALSAATGGDPLKGAAVGAVGGAAIGVITQDGRERKVYRHRNGRRFWLDDRGRERFLGDER
jgi:osmotically inducible lipoprotein OsmB